MSTPERQQDPGEHGYGGTHQEKKDADGHEHPLEDPDADSRQDDDNQDEHDAAHQASSKTCAAAVRGDYPREVVDALQRREASEGAVGRKRL